MSKTLRKAGFQCLSETAEWNLKPGGRYFFTRNLSTLAAFAVGSEFRAGNGFHMLGAHTDRCKAVHAAQAASAPDDHWLDQ